MSSTHHKSKVLITGASGFLGSSLCQRLLAEDAEIHAVSRVRRHSDSSHLCWWEGDLSDIQVARTRLREIKPDIVIHLAGLSSASPELELVLPTFNSLLVSTVNLLQTLCEVGCRRVILAGSLTEPLWNSVEALPGSPYAAAKWACSGYARMFHKLYHVPVVTVRPFMTYGPRQNEHKLIPHVILSRLKGQMPKLGNGDQRFDWIYVDDIVEGFLRAIEVPGIEGRTIDLGTGVLLSARTVVNKIFDLMGSSAPPQFGALPDRPFEEDRPADIRQTYEAMGWQPTTSLSDGLRRTIAWYSGNSSAYISDEDILESSTARRN